LWGGKKEKGISATVLREQVARLGRSRGAKFLERNEDEKGEDGFCHSPERGKAAVRDHNRGVEKMNVGSPPPG